MKDKLRENRLRWFGHIQRRPTVVVMMRCDVTVERNVRGWDRPRLTLASIVNWDMNLIYMTNEMVFGSAAWRKMIYVADLISWDLWLGFISSLQSLFLFLWWHLSLYIHE